MDFSKMKVGLFCVYISIYIYLSLSIYIYLYINIYYMTAALKLH